MPDSSTSVPSGKASAADSPSTLRQRNLGAATRRIVVGFLTGATALSLLIEATRVVTFWGALGLCLLAGGISIIRRGAAVIRSCVLALGLTTSVIVFTPIIDRTVEWLDIGQAAPQHADAVVVLGAGMHCGSGQLDSTSTARLHSGLALWRAGIAPVLVISDSDPDLRPAGCKSQADAQTQFITALYPTEGPELVELARMRTTATEAREVARIAPLRGWENVVVVTSPTHTRRARDTFRRAGLDPIMVSAAEGQYDPSFSRPVSRIRATGLVLREVAGLTKSKLR
jgi:uncharacterized SAM-binding protein YcdF (DUF218 family)